MPIFGGGLANWIDGEVITGAKLNALITALKTFLNTTKQDSSNLQAGGVSMGNLATPRVVFPLRFTVVQPGQNLPAGGVIGAPGVLITRYQAYLEDLGEVKLPYACRVFKVECYSYANPVDGAVQMFLAGVAQAPTILVNSDVLQEANVAIDVAAGQIISVRMAGLVSFAALPLTYTIWCRADLQSAP